MRNKIRLSLIVAFIGLLIASCENEEIDSMYKDFRFQTKILPGNKADPQSLYLNTAFPFSILVNKNDPNIGAYNLSYTLLEGKGLLYYKDSLLIPGEPVCCEGVELPLHFVPSALGRFQLKLQFQNDIINVTDFVAGKVEKEYFNLIAENLPPKLIINEPFTFSLKLVKPDDGNSIVKYKTFAQTIEGTGKITILNHSQDSSDTDYLIPGNNKVSYCGNTEGNNIIRFNILNEYELSQTIDIPLKIELPDVVLKIICDSVFQAGTNNFLISLKNTDRASDNNYWISYRNLKNDATLKIAGSEIKPGSTLEISPGDNVCEFTPLALGETQIEFAVKDKYNTIRKDTAKFSVVESVTDISVSNFSEECTINNLKYFNFAINKKHYTGKFKCEIVQEPIGADISINGLPYLGGKTDIAHEDNTLIGFIPKHLGKGKLLLRVYDDYNSCTTKELVYFVENSAGKINISNHNPSINIFSQTTFNFSVEKPNYQSTFQFEIVSSPVDAGTITINGKNYTGGITEIVNPLNTLIGFTPKTLNDVTLTIKVHDSYGGIFQQDVNYKIGNTDINLLVNGLEKELIVNKETNFNFTVEKPFFQGKLNFSVSAVPADAGLIQVNGSPFIPNLHTLPLSNGSSNVITFLPVREGKVMLSLNVSDDFNGIKSYPITYNVTNPPISLEIIDYHEQAIIHTEQKFKFSVKKNNYTDKFTCKLISSSVSVFLNNTTYDGSTIELNHNDNNIVTYIPTAVGASTLMLQVTDNTNQKTERTLNFNVVNPALEVKIGNIENDLTLNKRSNFTLNARKINYKGKFHIELATNSCKDIKIDGTNYSPNTQVLLQNPENTNISFIPTTTGTDSINIYVYDEWGLKTKNKVCFNVNNSDISLDINNLETQLFLGKTTRFTFTGSKPDYPDKLNYEIISTPSDIGRFIIAGKKYISGKQQFTNALPVEVTFIPEQPGEVTHELIISDEFGGKKSKTFTFNISNPEIEAEISDFISSALLNTENFFYCSLKKKHYDGPFYFSVTTIPLNAGTIYINDTLYTNGRFTCFTPQTKFGFTPTLTGDIQLHLNITDNTGSRITKELKYSVATYPIKLTVSNQETGLVIDQPTSFNFSLSREGYDGKFLAEITTNPVKAGEISINGEPYTGGKIEIVNKTNTQVSFTPSIIGDIRMFLTAFDEQGTTTSKQLNFSVKNSDFGIVVSNQEKDIQLGKTTTFNLSVIKPNYTGKYEFEIKQNPENSGTLIVNGTSYQGGKQVLNNPANTIIEYTSYKEGNNSLIFNVCDKNQGIAQKTIYFNTVNPPIIVNITNKAEEAIINTPTTFNIAINKDYYTDVFEYQIEPLPANSCDIVINEQKYKGGFLTADNPQNIPVTLIPHSAGNLTLKLTVKDKVKGFTSQDLGFVITNPSLVVDITNHLPDLVVNLPTSFNYTVSKEHYPGKYYSQITQVPAGMGSIKLNGNPYDGGKYEITDKNSNLVEFIARKTGSVVLKLLVSDEWGLITEKLINFSVSNSDFKINFTNQEHSLLLNKATTFNFSVEKPNYTEGYSVSFTLEPENAGKIFLNNSEYSSDWLSINGENNELKFLPQQTGAVLMKLKVKDVLNGEKEVALNYEVTNPPITLEVTNKEENLIFNTPTSFNVTASKDYYQEGFTYQIKQVPAGSGTLSVNGEGYSGGILPFTDPNNCVITFLPTVEGNVTLELVVRDKVGGESRENINFKITNPDLKLDITEHETDIIVHSPSTFNFTVSKPNYNGKFYYQLTQQPANQGVVKINNDVYNGGKLLVTNPNSNLVSFTANKTGAVMLKLEVSDEWEKSITRFVTYSVSNSDMHINVRDKEYSLLLNKSTQFSFDIEKPNYNRTFKAAIELEPANAGKIKINNSAYSGGLFNVTANNNRIEFSPQKAGAVLLRLKIQDELGGEKEVALNFNVLNPPINIKVTNQEENLTLNASTRFNIAISKNNYAGDYEYEFYTSPANAGTILLNGSKYTGGIKMAENPDNTQVELIPNQSGFVVFYIYVRDKTGAEITKTLQFNVQNPPLDVIINNPTSILKVGQNTRFTIKPVKDGYDSNFVYEITPYPYNSSNISVGGKAELTGSIGSSITEVSFTPLTPGNITLKVRIADDWGSEIEKEINFIVSNPPLKLSVLNNEKNIVVNQTTNFNLSATKENYADDKNIYYSISPARNIVINGQNYNGGTLQTKFSEFKKNISVSYTPEREGENILNVYAYDEYGQTDQADIKFYTTNPSLKVFLSGVEESAPNSVNLNETFKFTLNADKEYYTDMFAYWITVSPADAAIIAASDITPRSRAGNGSGTITGTISNSEFSMSTAEIRLIPNNSSYLNQNIRVNIRVRDKWGYEVSKDISFNVITSALMVDVVRSKTSIQVQEPYQFYFTVDKPNYNSGFKYSITGNENEDLLEISKDGTTFTPYQGGKYDVPDKDHTYIRFTPHQIGTSPLKLIIYDNNNSSIEKNITFDVKAPEISILGGGTKKGLTQEYISFPLVVKEEKGETMNASFDVDKTLDGEVLFNKASVYNSRLRSSPRTATPILSGSHSLEIMSRQTGQYTTKVDISNIWNYTATVNSTIEVEEPQFYTLDISIEGQGEVQYAQKSTYNPGDQVTFTAIPAKGWLFAGWQGDLTGSNVNQTLTMNSNKRVKAVFIKNPAEPVNMTLSILSGATPPPSEGETAYCTIYIQESSTQKTIFTKTINYPTIHEFNFSVDIDKTQSYIIKLHVAGSPFRDPMRNKQYEVTQSGVTLKFANGDNRTNGNEKYYYDTSYTFEGSVFFGNATNEIIGFVSYKSTPIDSGFEPSNPGHTPSN